MNNAMQQDVLQRLQQHTNFDLLETIQDNERYLICLIRQEGQKRILKVAQDTELIPNLIKEIENTQYLSTVTKYRKDTILQLRDVHSCGWGWYIGEHFDKALLFNRGESNNEEEKAKRSAKKLAYLFAEMESYAPIGFKGKPLYVDEDNSPTKRFERRMREVAKLTSIAREGGFLSEDASRRITDFIYEYSHTVTAGIELWDLEPWEVFELEDGKLGLIDLEYTDLAGRRYFDIVWNYHRLWAELKLPEAAKTFLGEFIRVKEIDNQDFATPFLVLFGMKLTGYLRDAALWYKDTKEKGYPVIYSPQEMDELLHRYLSFDISALTD